MHGNAGQVLSNFHSDLVVRNHYELHLRRHLPTRLSALLVMMSLGIGAVSAQVTRNYTLVALQGEPTPSAGPTAKYGILGFHPRIGPNGHAAADAT